VWRILEDVTATLKSSTIVVVLLAGTSAAMAQNGPATAANGLWRAVLMVPVRTTATCTLWIRVLAPWAFIFLLPALPQVLAALLNKSAADVRGSGPRPPALVC
jgi:hypothetical protein